MERFLLSGTDWTMKEFLGEDWVWRNAHRRETRDVRWWKPGSVPSSVTGDLLRCGAIPDPFFEANSLQLEWISQRTWVYRKTFRLPESMRGQRLKILVNDEAPEVKESEWNAIASPVKNTKRDICHQYDLKDYPSKTVSITSACLKSNYFFKDFLLTLKEMRAGNPEYFACALDYLSAIRGGITDMEFFEEERRRLPDSVFAMEYGSCFVGEEADSLFPYDLTETCRTLRHVEIRMPKGSKSEYIISVDIAMSARKEADNTVVSVIKLAPRVDGTIMKKVVYIRSYHGQKMSA